MSFGTQRLIGAITSAFVAAAMVVSAAQARPDDRGGMLGPGTVTVEQTDRPDDRPGALGVGSVSPEVTLAYPALADEGFEWGTEEIGTVVALTMALLAATLLFTSRRRERALGY